MARKNSAGKGRLVDHDVMRALLKPLRASILAILSERIASPKEIGNELGEALSTVNYHVKVLVECGRVELDHKKRRRGAVEHFYRAVDPTLLPEDVWDLLPKAMKEQVSACILREFLHDAAASAEAGIFDDPLGEIGWIPLVLDRPGVERMSRLVREFLESVLEEQAAASRRIRAAPRARAPERIATTVFLASFPSTRDPRKGRKASAMKTR